jgi:hypothetical protein
MNNVTIQCISLPDSDRRKTFSSRLDIPFMFFDAVDCRKFKNITSVISQSGIKNMASKLMNIRGVKNFRSF